MKYGVLWIDRGELIPQGFGTRAAPLAHVKRNNLTCGGVLGTAGKAFHHEVQQSRQADVHRTAHPAQGDALA